MKVTTAAALATASVFIVGSPVPIVRAQSGFETEPVLKATDLVGPELLKGPHFTVDARVPVKGFLARFTIRSTYGTFDAHGIHMFQIRVKEVYALTQLDGMSKTTEFAEAAGKSIARPVTSAANMIINPVETVEGLPGGVARLFDRIKLGGEAIAAAAAAPSQTESRKRSSITQRVGSITVDALGFEKERRRPRQERGRRSLHHQPRSSPRSSPTWRGSRSPRRFGIETAMSVLVPDSIVLSAVTITNSTVYDTPPGDLVNNAQSIFAGTGASEAQVQRAHEESAVLAEPPHRSGDGRQSASGRQRARLGGGLRGGREDAGRDPLRGREPSTSLARYHERARRIAVVSAPGPIIGRTTGGGWW